MRIPFTWLAGRRSAAIDRIVVAVPARNEAERLPRCLASLEEARRHVSVDVEVVVVLDSCTDDSAECVAAADRIVIVDVGNVGAARAAGFAAASADATDRTWLMSTDADCEVPTDWFANHLRFADAGARVVCGTVQVDNWTHLGEQTRVRYLDGYHFGDDHRHVHGANLGILSAEYRAVGGFAALVTGEDVDLVQRLAARGPITWFGGAPVVTSARLEGRAPDGFARHLQQLHSAEAG